MQKQLIGTAILSLTTGVAFAEQSLKIKGSVTGQVRLGYVKIDDNAGNDNDTLAIGGKLGYKTGSYRGLSAGATFYTTNPIAGIDDEGFFFDSNGDGYSILGEAYVNAELGKTTVTLGRQEFDSPFADTDDVGMIPNTFEGLVVTNTNLPNTTLVASHMQRWAGVDAPVPEKFTQMNDDKGVNLIGAIYEVSDKGNFQGWYYNAKDATDFTYLEAGLNPIKNLALGIQYATQDGGGFDGNVWGVSAEYGIGDFTISAAHNKVSDGQVSDGFGGGPFFTSAEEFTIAEVDNQEATSLGVEYSGFKNLTLAASQYNLDQGEDELDLTASYELNDKLSADLIYCDLKDDGHVVRAILNYNF